MIPLRISLKGFMSYREEQTLLFDGAPLWVLTGPNGTGKSAIFDAITFALYGKYRGGSQNARDLINHGADALTVEFDFLVDGSLHRVRRVVRQRGLPTREAFHLVELADSDEPHVEPIPGTDADKGFNEWVGQTIGLTYETFTSSVLLLQGDSEKLLKAQPRERYSILAELLDLSPYQQLAKAADDRRREHESQATLLAQQLRGMAVVTEADLTSAQGKADLADESWDKAQARVEELVERLAQARNWERLTSDLRRLQAQIEKAHDLLNRATDIRQGFARWRELEQMVPKLETISEQRRRSAEQAQQSLNLEREAEKEKNLVADGQRRADDLDSKAEQLTIAVRKLESQKTTVMSRLAELAPLVAKLEQVEGTKAQITRLADSLAQFPSDLSQSLSDAEARDNQLAEMEQALPWLRQLVESRSSLAEAVAQQRHTIEESETLVASLSQARAEYLDLEKEAVDARKEETRLAHEVTRAETAWSEAHERLVGFQKAAAQPTCSLCGQRITPEHAHQEMVRLTALDDGAERQVKASRTEHQKAKRHLEQVEASLQTKDTELRTLTENEKANRREQQQTERDIAHYAERVSRAYLNLPTGLQASVAREPASNLLDWLDTTYPNDSDLRYLTSESSSRSEHSKRLQELRRQMGKRQGLEGQLQEAQRSLEDLLTRCRVDEAQQARRETAELAERKASIESKLQLQEQALAQARSDLSHTRRALEKQRAQLAQTEARLAGAKAKQDEIERSIETAVASLPDHWQEPARLVDAARLGALQAEQMELAEYVALASELERASQSADTWQKECQELESQIASIPVPAQRPSAEVECELAIARGESATADLERRQAQGELEKLGDQLKRRGELEEAHRSADRQHHLYKTLATLLGPKGLQLHLLRRAEHSIVDLANQTLDGLSRGRMRLELRGSDGQGGEQSEKALDLVVYNYDTGTKSMPIALASGSQRFRIAVSLALAIGRYAGQGARYIESVIIDEGFGSLDKNARDDMIQELNELQRQLARVILVSHQEEFAGAFASGYAISLEDNASRVSLLEPS